MFKGAILLAVGAVAGDENAIDENCCIFYPEAEFRGTGTTLCYNDHDRSEPTYFKAADHGIDAIGSYRCGKSVQYNFCELTVSKGWKGYGGYGPIDHAKIDLPMQPWIKMNWYRW